MTPSTKPLIYSMLNNDDESNIVGGGLRGSAGSISAGISLSGGNSGMDMNESRSGDLGDANTLGAEGVGERGVNDSVDTTNTAVLGELNRATMASCYITLANTIVGAAILGIPFAFSNTGWVFGTIMHCLCAWLSGMGVHLLALCTDKFDVPRPCSFYKVAELAIPGYSFLVDLAIAIKCFGISTSYLIVIGDSLPKAMEQFHAGGLLTDRHFCIVVGFCFLAPLACFPSLDEVRFTTTMSGIMICFLAFVIFLFALHIPALDPCTITPAGNGATANAAVDLDAISLAAQAMYPILSSSMSTHSEQVQTHALLSADASYSSSLLAQVGWSRSIFAASATAATALSEVFVAHVGRYVSQGWVGLSTKVSQSVFLNDESQRVLGSAGADVSTDNCDATREIFTFDFETAKSLPIFIFSYGCQQNTFTIVNELRDPTRKRVDTVIIGALFTAWALYMLTTFSGYATFGRNVEDDILTMYPEVPIISFCRIAVSIIVACHYPLQFHPARKSVLSLCNRFIDNYNTQPHLLSQADAHNRTRVCIDADASAFVAESGAGAGSQTHSGDSLSRWVEPSPTVYRIRYIVSTIIFLCGTLTIALTFTNLGEAMAVVGSTGSTLMIFILPGTFYYYLHKDDDFSDSADAAGRKLSAETFNPALLGATPAGASTRPQQQLEEEQNKVMGGGAGVQEREQVGGGERDDGCMGVWEQSSFTGCKGRGSAGSKDYNTINAALTPHSPGGQRGKSHGRVGAATQYAVPKRARGSLWRLRVAWWMMVVGIAIVPTFLTLIFLK